MTLSEFQSHLVTSPVTEIGDAEDEVDSEG
jgi:hypothetical protein